MGTLDSEVSLHPSEEGGITKNYISEHFQKAFRLRFQKINLKSLVMD